LEGNYFEGDNMQKIVSIVKKQFPKMVSLFNSHTSCLLDEERASDS